MNRRRQATLLLATSARAHARTSVLGLRPPFVAQEFVVEYVGEYISAAEAERRSYAGPQLQPHPGQQMGAPRLPLAHACGALCRPRTLSPVAGEYMMELPGRGNGGGKAGVVTIDAFAMRNIAAWHAARGLPNPEAQQACARALRPLTNAGPCRHSINFSCDPNLTMDPVTAAHGAATPRLASASPFPHSGPLASLSASPLHTSLGDAAFPRVGFFAKRDIQPLEELGYRRDKNAISNVKRVGDCRCGAPRCSGNY